MSKDIEFNFEKYTVIMCNNINCKHNRRVIGDLHCNFKFITIDTEGNVNILRKGRNNGAKFD